MVSVIIPVYNCEKYIEECITSVLSQTYTDFEMLIVDDGSTDETSVIIQRLQLKDDRIRVIHLENQGVSHARNTGLAFANGEFVVFLDADDYLDTFILEKAVASIKADKLIAWGYTIIGKAPVNDTASYEISKYEAIASTLCTRKKVDYCLGDNFRASWGKLFDKKIIQENNVVFPENLPVGEDALFLLQYLTCCDGIRYIDNKGYNYRILENSAVRKPRKNLFEFDVIQMDYMMEMLKRYKCFDQLPVQISFHNWKWQLAFPSLLENSIIVGENGELTGKSVFDDTCAFIKKYEAIYKSCPVGINSLYKKYRVFQCLYGRIPCKWLCRIYLVMQSIRR